MNWFWIILIVALVYVGFDYGRLLISYRRVMSACSQFDYEPVRHIFIAGKDSAHVDHLSEVSMRVHIDNGYAVKKIHGTRDSGKMRVDFDNGDQLLFYEYGVAPIDALKKSEINSYVNRVFLDAELPEGAIRECIAQLGLAEYMFSFGLVQKEKKNG